MIKKLKKFFTNVVSSSATPTKASVTTSPVSSSVGITVKPAWNPPVTIAVINQTTVLTDEQITPVVEAIQIQVTRDFAPVWAVDAKLLQIPRDGTVPAGVWPMYLLDTSDTAGALGYHSDSLGVPFGRVFAKTDMEHGANWSITLSHEVLELLADPFIVSTVLGRDSLGHPRVYALEVCDPPEADQFGYMIGNVKVSDFVYPAWFGAPKSVNGKYDHIGKIKAPFQLLPGGYISYLQIAASGGWKQVTAQESLHPHREKIGHTSRRLRRQESVK